MPDTKLVSSLLNKILDEMLEGFQVIDKDWHYIYVNKTVARQGKSTKKELIGKTMMEAYPGIENTPLFKQLKKCQAKKVSAKMENEFIYPDKSKGWFQLHIQPWDKGLTILSIDITARKKAESKLNEKINELNKVMAMTVDRELKIAELKKIVVELKKYAPEGD